MRMMLVPKTPAFFFKCIKCGKVYHSTHDEALFINVYADLDGKAFTDYYCEICRNVLPGREADVIVKNAE